MKNKRKSDTTDSTKSTEIKESKHTNKKEKPMVSKKDVWTIEEIEDYVNSLQYEDKRASIETKEKRGETEIKEFRLPGIKRRRVSERVSREGKTKIFTPKKMLSVGAIIVFAVLILFCVVLPMIQGSMHFLIVLSGSMGPEINPGDIVVSKYTNPEEIKINDVITFALVDNPKKCVTHRVINITNENGSMGFQTKGDANEDPDQRIVQSSELIGKIVLVIPYLGYLPHFAKSPLGFITLIIVPGILIIFSEIWNIIRIKKKDSREKNRMEQKRDKDTPNGGDN